MGVQTGTKISLAGHGLLVGWAAFGGWFSSEPLPMQVQEVSVISAQDFARLSQQIQAPEVAATPGGLTPPENAPVPPVPPELPVRPETRPEVTPPVAVLPPAVAETAVSEPEPEPEPQVTVTLPPPAVLPDTPDVVPTLPVPEQLRPADRVAPVPVEAPEQEVAIDDLVQPEVTADQGALSEKPEQEATAPEAASDRIVTEANESDTAEPSPAAETPPETVAPKTSVRPKTRPQRPAPVAVADSTLPPDASPETSSEAAEDTRASAIEDALSAAIAGGADVAAPEPSGPPLTNGERDALRVSVSKCWNVGSLSSDALKTTVEVAVSLDQDGRPQTGTIRLVSSTGGSSGAAKQAYEAARRAIIRCGAKGFQLPAEKFDHWRDIVMTFNPEKMRIK